MYEFHAPVYAAFNGKFTLPAGTVREIYGDAVGMTAAQTVDIAD